MGIDKVRTALPRSPVAAAKMAAAKMVSRPSGGDGRGRRRKRCNFRPAPANRKKTERTDVADGHRSPPPPPTVRSERSVGEEERELQRVPTSARTMNNIRCDVSWRR